MPQQPIVSLPSPEEWKHLLRVQAILHIILCDEDWLRYQHYDPNWDTGVELSETNNGAGDTMFVLFTPEGVVIKGFDHESALSPYANEEESVYPGIYDEVPPVLLERLADEAISREDVTFCIWRLHTDADWQQGCVAIPSGESDDSRFLLGTVYRDPASFAAFAEDYYDCELPLDLVAHIYAGKPVTPAIVKGLNPERDAAVAMQELAGLLA